MNKFQGPAKDSGFTLLEVLLVSVLLFFLAITTFSAVKAIIETKGEIDYRTEFLQLSRASIALLDRDIRAAYYLVPEDLGWAPKKANPEANPPILQAVKPPIVTIFQGSADSLFFSSKSHQRLSANSPENEEHFVTYQLQDGKIQRAESRRAVSLKDREDKDKFMQFTLLEGVKTMKFRYWSKQQGKWMDDWDTERAENKDTLPTAVEVFIEFEPKLPEGSRPRKDSTVRINTIVRISETALKSEKEASNSSSPGQGEPTDSSGSSSSAASGPGQGGGG